MENYNLGSKAFIIATILLLTIVSCGLYEQKLELTLNNQVAEQPFSFKDYCKEDYDSIFILHSYFNTNRNDFVNLRMSEDLRNFCKNAIYSDAFSTILFISKGHIKAYSIIEIVDADFEAKEVEEQHIFPFEQRFIMDKDRNIHIYKE